MDIKSALRLLVLAYCPDHFNLLGFKNGSKYFIDTCMPMGCYISYSTFETFSTFKHWLT